MRWDQWSAVPPIPWPGPVFGNERPDVPLGRWACLAYWRQCAAGGESRFVWLAPVKALWNVTLYRLARLVLTTDYYERHGFLDPWWYTALWWGRYAPGYGLWERRQGARRWRRSLLGLAEERAFSAEILALAEEAARVSAAPIEDEDTWARPLAADLARFTD